MVFNPFKMVVQLFQTASNFPNFDGQNAFFPKFNWPLAPTSERYEKPCLQPIKSNGMGSTWVTEVDV